MPKIVLKSPDGKKLRIKKILNQIVENKAYATQTGVKPIAVNTGKLIKLKQIKFTKPVTRNSISDFRATA